MNVTWKRLAGALVGMAYCIALMLAVGFGLESSMGYERAWRIASMFTYSGFGAAYVGWQWPDTVLRPFTAIANRLRK